MLRAKRGISSFQQSNTVDSFHCCWFTHLNLATIKDRQVSSSFVWTYTYVFEEKPHQNFLQVLRSTATGVLVMFEMILRWTQTLLFLKAQEEWWQYDVYARVLMLFGSCQFLYAAPCHRNSVICVTHKNSGTNCKQTFPDLSG